MVILSKVNQILEAKPNWKFPNMKEPWYCSTSLRNREDYDLILRYIKNFNGYHLRLPYYRYFKRSGSLSSLTSERERLKKKIDGTTKNIFQIELKDGASNSVKNDHFASYYYRVEKL